MGEDLDPIDGTFQEALDALSTQPVESLAILAAASRTQPHVRFLLGSAEVLRTLLDLVERNELPNPGAIILALRCIGNALIDNPIARSHVAKMDLSWITHCLQADRGPSIDGEHIDAMTLRVLHNLCFEHEEAQQACFHARLHYTLWTSQSLWRDMIPHHEHVAMLPDCLLHIAGQKSTLEPKVQQPIPDAVLRAAISLPSDEQINIDVDIFASLVESALCLLRDGTIQKQLIEQDLLKSLLIIVYTTHEKLSSIEDADQLEVLDASWKSLLWCVSDIAAHPLTAERYPLDSIELKTLITALIQYDQGHEISPRLAIVACQVIGNVVWNLSPRDCISFADGELADGQRIESILLRAIENSNDTELLHAAAGVLILLARCSVLVREIMGGHRYARPALMRLCGSGEPDLRRDGILLAKTLLRDSATNQKRFSDLSVDFSRAIYDGTGPVTELATVEDEV